MRSSDIIAKHDSITSRWLHSRHAGVNEVVENYLSQAGIEAMEMGACLYYAENTTVPIRSIEFETADARAWGEVVDDIAALFHYLTGRIIEIHLEKRKLWQKRIVEPQERREDVVLFSGGLDSFYGVWWLLGKQRLPAIVHSMTHQNILGKASKVYDEAFKGYDLPFYYVNSKFQNGCLGNRYYPQTRSTLFILNAVPIVEAFKSDTIWIPENGGMMVNPPPSNISFPTKSTRPVVLHLLERIVSGYVGRPVRVDSPFKDMTKAEVAAVMGMPETLDFTFSCFVSRPSTHQKMCGRCYGCNVTRLSLNALGLKDDRYVDNPFEWKEAPSGVIRRRQLFLYLDMLSMAAEYARTGHANHDTMEHIGEVSKAYDGDIDVHDLMRRFSLDILVGVNNFYRMNKIPPESTLLGSRLQEVLDDNLMKELQQRSVHLKKMSVFDR